MKDAIVKICLALLNFMSVSLLCCAAGPPKTQALGLVRGLLVLSYFITFMLMHFGEEN